MWDPAGGLNSQILRYRERGVYRFPLLIHLQGNLALLTNFVSVLPHFCEGVVLVRYKN